MGVFAYYDADGGTVYHVIPSPESESAPSLFHSETPSTASGTTIHSDDLPGYFILHHGRQQSSSENIAKWFPPDNIRRYVVRYLGSKSIFGGNYIGRVKEMLAPVEGRRRHVLELGTRVGTWIQSMATEFPHVQFRTLDVVPMIPHVPRHNVIFEVYDFTEGLLLDDGSQDAVFLNNVLEVVNDYRALLREAYRVLRPGGLIHINDFQPGLWDPEDVSIPAHRTAPLGCRFNDVIRRRISSFGIDPDTCNKLPQWIAPQSDLWDKAQSGFKDIRSDMRTYPFFAHDNHPCMNQIDPSIAPYLRHLTVESLQDMVGLVQDSGLAEEEAKRLIYDTLEEAKHPESCSMIKVYCIYGIKI